MTGGLAAPPVASAMDASEAESFVQQIYRLALDRPAGPEDVSYWAPLLRDGGLSAPHFLRHVMESTEAAALRQRRAAAGGREEIEALVRQLYEAALSRKAEGDELAYWSSQMLDEGMSAPAFVSHLTGSPEAERVRLARQSPWPGHALVSAEVDALVVRIYQWALHRTPNAEDLHFWTGMILDGKLSASHFVENLAQSEEAERYRQAAVILPEVPNGRFIQYAYERLLGRAPMASEVVHWDHRLSQGELGREDLVKGFFTQQARHDFAKSDQAPLIDPNIAHVMGTGGQIGIDEWLERAALLDGPVEALAPKIYPALALPGGSGILVSVIVSLYRGGAYIRRFLDIMTTQTIFEACELIIIDADSPEDEYAVIAPYLERFSNIVYQRTETRIGIYDAWNLGARMARGRYLTNANLDDLRRHDSFERQAEILEKFPFVDVVYQDFFYSFDGQASFARSAAAGVRSDVPVISPYNLAWSNSPHNAPMWRRSLHNEVGWFDTSYRSAGDYDFWLRCMLAGKTFYKVNDPHVVYYVNPAGISTRPDTRGVVEANRIMNDHGPKILSEHLLSTGDAFLAHLGTIVPEPLDLSEAEQAVPDWRYVAAQRALRRLSAASRHTA